MAEYPKIQERLNTDPEYRKRFLREPAAVLREGGMTITPEKEKQLTEFVKQASAAAGPAADHKINVNAGIGIGVRF